MRMISAEWRNYMESVLGDDTEDLILTDIRAAFYAGAASASGLILGEDRSPEQAQRLVDDLMAFVE